MTRNFDALYGNLITEAIPLLAGPARMGLNVAGGLATRAANAVPGWGAGAAAGGHAQAQREGRGRGAHGRAAADGEHAQARRGRSAGGAARGAGGGAPPRTRVWLAD